MAYDCTPSGGGSRGWLAIAAGHALLLTPELPDPAAAWAALRGDRGFESALALLTADGHTTAPPFVLLHRGEGADARLLVRGTVTVEIEDASGSATVDADGVATWVERTVDGLTALRVTVPGAAPAGDPLPLADGVTRIAALTLHDPAPTTPIVEDVTVVRPNRSGSTPRTRPIRANDDVEQTVTPGAEAAVEGAPAEEGTDLDSARPAGDADSGEPDSYDYLFGDTVFRSVADAAVRDDEDEAEPAAEEPAGDHDGQTVMTSDIAKLRKQRPSSPAEEPAPSAGPADTAAADTVPVLVLADGSRERLDQPLVAGRSPGVSQVPGGSLPRLLTVGDGDQDISRSHVRFAVEGGTVVVTDLHSKNGTSVALPGKPSQKLRPGEPTSVIAGTLIDLGGGVTFTVDEG